MTDEELETQRVKLQQTASEIGHRMLRETAGVMTAANLGEDGLDDNRVTQLQQWDTYNEATDHEVDTS